ncbi:DUF6263 family protein [Tenacibaculum sp. M341]|uniref:DUF6263 family protein n=1 Tax=Tenacibaculum sp. M341 TaxID=2530339 RepID=UPI0010500591|nr:DUF6263 family protein [Tenacibaculum sp. M341]TCI84726.1 hypothetical protein EYW44_20005 [Tenacibaculum sp. M341]
MKKILVALLLLVTTISFSQEKVLLRYKYNKGETYQIKMKMFNDMGNSNSIAMNFVMKQEIKDEVGGVYSAEATIQKIVADMKQSGMVINYDSSKKEEELGQMEKMMKPQMDEALKTVIFIKADELGNVLETKITPSSPTTNGIGNQTNIVYPKEAVKVGDTWNATKNENGLEFNFTYKVVAISATNVDLDVNGTLAGLGKGDISGKMKLDVSNGMPITSNLTMNMEVSGMKMSTKIDVETTKM